MQEQLRTKLLRLVEDIPKDQWPLDEEGDPLDMENFRLDAIFAIAGGDWQTPRILVFFCTEEGIRYHHYF